MTTTFRCVSEDDGTEIVGKYRRMRLHHNQVEGFTCMPSITARKENIPDNNNDKGYKLTKYIFDILFWVHILYLNLTSIIFQRMRASSLYYSSYFDDREFQSQVRRTSQEYLAMRL